MRACFVLAIVRACFMLARVRTPSSPVREREKERKRKRERERERGRSERQVWEGQTSWEIGCWAEAKGTTPVGFEPTRGDPIGLAGRRLSRSAKVSVDSKGAEHVRCD